MALSQSEMRKLRPKMQIIFQDPYESLNPRMTVLDLVAEPLEVNDLIENEAEKESQEGEESETSEEKDDAEVPKATDPEPEESPNAASTSDENASAGLISFSVLFKL